MRYDALGAVSCSAVSRYGVFTRKQAASNGMSRAEIARLVGCGVLKEPRPRVLVWAAVERSWEQTVAIAQAAGGGHGVASHRTAGRLHLLDGCRDLPIIELLSERRIRLEGVTSHQAAELAPADVVLINGIPTTNLARTLCDLASVVEVGALERAIDSARRRGISLLWLRQTALRLHRPGQRGTNAIFAQLDAIDPTHEVRGSWFEKMVKVLLVDPRIPPLVEQFEVRDAGGDVVARPDLAIPSIRLAIEAHSREFHFGRAAELIDEDRDHRLAVLGWDTLYLGYQSTRRAEATAELVATTVAVRTAQLAGGG